MESHFDGMLLEINKEEVFVRLSAGLMRATCLLSSERPACWELTRERR